MAFQLVQKQKRCRRLLIEWSKKIFPNNRKVIDEIMRKIGEIQDKDATV